MGIRAVFDKGHKVAGLNAKHTKQLHGAPRRRSVGGYAFRHSQRLGRMAAPRPMGVYLEKTPSRVKYSTL